MSEPLLRAARYRFRATFRRRWSGYLTLALLIGLVGGVALGSLTAARRTYASYPSSSQARPSDLLVLPQTSTRGRPGARARPAAARARRRGGRADHRCDTDAPAGSRPSWRLRSSWLPARTACSPTRTG